MIKFIPVYSCYKVDDSRAFAICGDAKTGDVEACHITSSGVVYPLLSLEKLPDVRRYHACRFQALSVVQRSALRGWWQGVLELRHGAEPFPYAQGEGVFAPCD